MASSVSSACKYACILFWALPLISRSLYPRILSRPRWPIIICMIICAASYLLWSLAPSWIGINYWKCVVPGMILGSSGMQFILLATK